MHYRVPSQHGLLLNWADKTLPIGKRLPPLYVERARMLIASRQPLAIVSDLGDIPSRPPTTSFRSARLPRNIHSPIEATFLLNSSTYERYPTRTSTQCVGCGRPALATQHPPAHVVCSPQCLLAVRLVACDILALSGQPRPIPTPPNGLLLTFVHGRHLGPQPRDTIKRTTQPFHPFILHGKAAKTDPLGLASSVVVAPHLIREALRKMLIENDEDQSPVPHTQEEIERALADARALSPLSGGSAPSTSSPSHAGHSASAIATAPATPDPTDLVSPAPPPASPLSLPASGSPLLSNPVSRRAAEIVLHHLETANVYLGTPKAKSDPKRIWDRDQIALFLGLYNRTVPALSAALNINASPPTKDPSQMTREELEEAAANAKPVNAREAKP